MTTENFIDFARMHGYGLRFTGIGMAYVVLNDTIFLTESMDIDKAERELMLIGMAIMNDTVRAM